MIRTALLTALALVVGIGVFKNLTSTLLLVGAVIVIEVIIPEIQYYSSLKKCKKCGKKMTPEFRGYTETERKGFYGRKIYPLSTASFTYACPYCGEEFTVDCWRDN